jgi:hypothetical protein
LKAIANVKENFTLILSFSLTIHVIGP